MTEPKTILVRAPNWIGDQILAYPFYYFLRKRYPHARIISACVPWVSSLQFKRQVDEVFILDLPVKNREGKAGLYSKWKAIEKNANRLKGLSQKLGVNTGFGLGISLPNSLSSAWLLSRAGVSRRRGYATDGRGILLNDPVKWNPDPERHRAQAYADLLTEYTASEIDVKEFWPREPENPLDDELPGVLTSFDAENEWGSKDLLAPPKESYWVCAPGATADSRRWPIEYFVELARGLYSKLGYKTVVVGGPKEAKFADILVNAEGVSAVDFTALGQPSALWKVFQGAKFTVTNESGLAHVASLCGSPVHIVCGAADPRRTRPIGPGRVRISVNSVECWPCERNTCFQPAGKQIQCLLGIRPERVEEELGVTSISRFRI